MTTELTLKPASGDLSTRVWRTDPLGKYDRPVEIWHNNNWVPAYFSEIKAGDFFLRLNSNLNPMDCFRAASNVQQVSTRYGLTFVMQKGAQIVQRPALATLELKDINEIPLNNQKEEKALLPYVGK